MTTAPLPTLDAERAGGRHPVDIGHLVMGLAFLGLVAIWAIIQTDAVEGDDVRWLLPLPWVVAGAAGLLATTSAGFRRRPRTVGGPLPADPSPFEDSDTDSHLETPVHSPVNSPIDAIPADTPEPDASTAAEDPEEQR